jgi:hypothetical protein
MNDTLLTGKPYVSSAKTDIRKTFARLRREAKAADEKQQAERLDKIARTVTPFMRGR